jgi:hypothetical protein
MPKTPKRPRGAPCGKVRLDRLIRLGGDLGCGALYTLVRPKPHAGR